MDRQIRSPIIPSLVPETSDLALDRLLSPAKHFRHPDDVLKDDTLDIQEKRAILSSWASDLWTVESCPWLREVPGIKGPLRVSDIFAALRSLDDRPPPPGGASIRAFSPRTTSDIHVHRHVAYVG